MLLGREGGRQSHRSLSETGFTILELMVATAVFAVVLLVIAVGVIRITDDYYGGVTSSNTQTVARAIISELSETIEFSTSAPVVVAPVGANPGALCIDNTMYMFQPGQEVIDKTPFAAHQGYHGLIAETSASCTPSWPAGSALPSGARELLGRNMRLAAFDVVTAGNLTTIHIRVISGDDTLLTLPVNTVNLPNEECANKTGFQFCAVADLTTSVERRL